LYRAAGPRSSLPLTSLRVQKGLAKSADKINNQQYQQHGSNDSEASAGSPSVKPVVPAATAEQKHQNDD
jgi:hypothetical protein